MIGGFSSCKGIMIYDTNKEIPNAVYAYYDHDEIKVVEGEYEEIKKFRMEQVKPYERTDRKDDKIVLILFLVMFFTVILSLIYLPFIYFIATLLFCLCAYFPILVLIFANMNTYNSNEMYHQGRRYHACEHALMNLIGKDKEVNLDNLKSTSIYEAECGNVYSGNILFLCVVLFFLVINIVKIGLLKAIFIFLALIVILFINIFNPYSPFKLLQKPTIEQPTEKEYLLAIELSKQWQRIVEENDSEIIE